MAKKASVRFTFPLTKVIYLSVVKPDTEYNSEGTYQVSLVYPLKTAQALKAQIENLSPEFAGLVNFRENDDGTASFKVKQNRVLRWVDKKTGEKHENIMTPTILNKDNTPYDAEANGEPWGGTTAEVAAVIETQAGARGKGTILAMRLRGVRIHDLVKGGGSGDPMFGAPVDSPFDSPDESEDLPFDGGVPVADSEDDDDAPI